MLCSPLRRALETCELCGLGERAERDELLARVGLRRLRGPHQRGDRPAAAGLEPVARRLPRRRAAGGRRGPRRPRRRGAARRPRARSRSSPTGTSCACSARAGSSSRPRRARPRPLPRLALAARLRARDARPRRLERRPRAEGRAAHRGDGGHGVAQAGARYSDAQPPMAVRAAPTHPLAPDAESLLAALAEARETHARARRRASATSSSRRSSRRS